MVMQQIVIMVNAITIVAPLVTVLLTIVANYDHYRNCNYKTTTTTYDLLHYIYYRYYDHEGTRSWSLETWLSPYRYI